jgi:quinol monooxygenase YgiN
VHTVCGSTIRQRRFYSWAGKNWSNSKESLRSLAKLKPSVTLNTIERKAEIVSTTKIIVLPEYRKEWCLTMSALLEMIRREEGCRTYRLYGESGNQNSFMLFGEWATRAALEEHLQSEHFAVLLGSLRLLTKQSKFDFCLLSHIAGIEALARARRGS